MVEVTYKTSTPTVLILFFCLLGLIVLLVLLYKKLNRDANGEYTVQRMVYKDGGVRDRVRGTVLALGTRFGVQLWPQSDDDGEEMQGVQVEEGQVEDGGSQESDSEGDEKENDEEQRSMAKEKDGDTSEDNSSVESSEAEEQARLTGQSEAKGEIEEKGDDGEGKGEASGGAGLLVDLKQFSGSAIWSEEEGGEGKNSDITAL
ncbi:hypothetical protein CesoFtcFv8_026928 [Champsocephalus esox]|uniref:Uncharacterized protein n=1 Tax=Champsocephalus esox TaxID=159716 RepID=A0AAN8B0J9_9TELE|nr:hypothetical protein CesoFtcFv8_026928 [Champsocephalus esox]